MARLDPPLAIGISVLALSFIGLSACGDDDEGGSRARADGGSAGEAGSGTSGGSGGTSGGSGGTSGTGASGGTGGTQAQGGEAGVPEMAGAGGEAEGGAPGSAGAAGAMDAGGEAGAPAELDGMQIFRHDTFGSEQFWTDVLRLNEFIQESLDPLTALAVGLKVDASVLPDGILEQVDLEDPATTVALLDLGAVVGVEGKVENGELVSVGITCALCHSDVDDSVIDGIGERLDGYANRDLNPGLIVSLAPGLADNDEAQQVYSSWGPGYFDPRFNQDGISDPSLIPPIYGLDGVPLETYTGDGPVSYWNSYVAVTQMGGQGSFFDPRIGVESIQEPDLVTPKLPRLFEYQMTLRAPEPDPDSFDADAAARGQDLFEGDARCSSCHTGPQLTDAAETLHDAEETDMDPTAAERSATGKYRTTPLRALSDHPPYFHDGSAETLEDVVDHYDDALDLGLSADERADLVEYLKSL